MRAVDVKYATGIEVPKSVQQRLVHRQDFELSEVQTTVEELSVDGGNIRIRTQFGKPCDWVMLQSSSLTRFASDRCLIRWKITS